MTLHNDRNRAPCTSLNPANSPTHTSRDKGYNGEDQAADFLLSLGYSICREIISRGAAKSTVLRRTLPASWFSLKLNSQKAYPADIRHFG